MENENKLTDFINLDKNIAKNIRFLDDEDGLARNIVVYLAWQWHNDPLNFGELDPKHFGEIMEYQGRNVFSSKVEHPFQVQRERLSAEEVEYRKTHTDDLNRYLWDTKLEDALYRLSRNAYTFENSGTTDEGNPYLEVESILILNYVKIEWKRGKQNQLQKTYKYQATEKYLLNFYRYFLLINKPLYVDLRKPRLQPLYLYFANLYHDMKSKNQSVATPNFDMLLQLANINISDPKERKKTLQKKIDNLFSQATHLSAKMHYGKVTTKSKANYQPIINFDFAKPELIVENVINRTLMTEYIHRLLDFFREKYSEKAFYKKNAENELFWRWCKNIEHDKNTKLHLLQNSYLSFYICKYEENKEYHDKMMNDLYEQLPDFIDKIYPPLSLLNNIKEKEE